MLKGTRAALGPVPARAHWRPREGGGRRGDAPGACAVGAALGEGRGARPRAGERVKGDARGARSRPRACALAADSVPGERPRGALGTCGLGVPVSSLFPSVEVVRLMNNQP